MRALVALRHGGPEVLEFQPNLPDPTPAPDQVLIEVQSSGVNFADVSSVRGTYPTPPPPFTPGLEVAGIERGSGRRVMALVSGGGYASLAVAPRSMVFDASQLDLSEAGAYALVTITCHLGLSGMAHLQPGESVLVLAGAGGIGSTAIQVAKALGAGEVVAVASTPEKRAFAISVGADRAVGYEDDFPACDVALDGVGGEAFAKAYAAAPPFGRIVMIGTSSGQQPTLPDAGDLRNRTVTLIPFSFGALRRAHPELVTKLAPAAVDLLRAGLVRPPIGLTLPLAEGATAVAKLADRATMGKVVLLP
ncbi:MAG: quinone oxidoreductase family protein [Candidatus Dormibacteraceae bacterium]